VGGTWGGRGLPSGNSHEASLSLAGWFVDGASLGLPPLGTPMPLPLLQPRASAASGAQGRACGRPREGATRDGSLVRAGEGQVGLGRVGLRAGEAGGGAGGVVVEMGPHSSPSGACSSP